MSTVFLSVGVPECACGRSSFAFLAFSLARDAISRILVLSGSVAWWLGAWWSVLAVVHRLRFLLSVLGVMRSLESWGSVAQRLGAWCLVLGAWCSVLSGPPADVGGARTSGSSAGHRCCLVEQVGEDARAARDAKDAREREQTIA